MEKKINLLLDQKHLLNQIDLFLYSSFLDDEEINNLLKLYKLKEGDLENLLNKLQIGKKKVNKKIFLDYFSFREKIRNEEREYFKRIVEEITKFESEKENVLT